MTLVVIALMNELKMKYFVERQASPGVLVPECFLLAMAACSCVSSLVSCSPHFFYHAAPTMVDFARGAMMGCAHLTGAASMSQRSFFDLEEYSLVELEESTQRLRAEMAALPPVFTAWFCNLEVPRANSVERVVQACLNCITDLLEAIEFQPFEYILNSLGQLLPNVVQRERALMARQPESTSEASGDSSDSSRIVVDGNGEEWHMPP